MIQLDDTVINEKGCLAFAGKSVEVDSMLHLIAIVERVRILGNLSFDAESLVIRLHELKEAYKVVKFSSAWADGGLVLNFEYEPEHDNTQCIIYNCKDDTFSYK